MLERLLDPAVHALIRAGCGDMIHGALRRALREHVERRPGYNARGDRTPSHWREAGPESPADLAHAIAVAVERRVLGGDHRQPEQLLEAMFLLRHKLLTAVALPVTALASIYGMNLIVNDQAQHAALAVVLILMGIVSALMLWWAKRQGWW